jgi:hypothetical protein
VIENRQTPTLDPAEHITELEVSGSGTLRMSDYAEPKTRAEFYDYAASDWSGSPEDLVRVMDGCQPLAWAVQSIYSGFREELQAELRNARGASGGSKRKLATLKARVEAPPKDTEAGTAEWLLGLTSKQFKDRVIPVIEQ